MNTINEIYRLNFMNNYWSYIGLLRNEKRFNLNDNVFFVINKNEIARGVIVGVELPPEQNPQYRYKIKLPEDLIRQRMDQDEWYKDNPNFGTVTLICDSIFNNIKEAKESAIKKLNHMFELQSEDIERYFKQFEK